MSPILFGERRLSCLDKVAVMSSGPGSISYTIKELKVLSDQSVPHGHHLRCVSKLSTVKAPDG